MNTHRVAALAGALAVVAGAFGAHALEERVTPERLDTWRTAVLWHALHALVLLVLARTGGGRLAIGLFSAGILLFSGSLYALVLLDLPILGAVTPFGGLCFIAAWLSLARSRP